MNDEDDSDDFTDPQVQRAAEEIRANWKRLAAVVDPDLLATAEDVVYYRGPWRLHGGYVVRTDADGRETRLHRLITGAPEDQYVDHANRNRADNRRENLRVCTPAQNSENKTLSRRNTSGVTGVTCHKTRAREGRQ
ncbi:MAG TPA: HNH endonuclease, partial [Gemmatimonadaceae bacterium]|nr:HNH endonuclease [Gemmatimonadaceae bacterium]